MAPTEGPPVVSTPFLQRFFVTIFEIIDAAHSQETDNGAKHLIATCANKFFVDLFQKMPTANILASDILVLTLINHNFANFRLFYPATLIQDKLKWKLSNKALEDLRFPQGHDPAYSQGFLHLLFVKLAFQDKSTRNKLNASVLEPITMLANQIHSTPALKFLQFEFTRACVCVLLTAERQKETVMDSKAEGFAIMAVSTLMRTYQVKPEVYFEKMVSVVAQVSFLVHKAFQKEFVCQFFSKFSLIFFRYYAEELLYDLSASPAAKPTPELTALCESVLLHLNDLYKFDIFFSTKETFLTSSLCKFTSDLVFQALEEYNLMISLPSVDVGLPDMGEPDSIKRQSIVFRQDNRFQLLTYLLYLQMLSASRKSIDLNEYLQSELGRCFNLSFLLQYIKSHTLDGGGLYFKVG